MATRVLNFVSAFLILTTGVYVEVVFADVLSDEVRFSIGIAVLSYMAVQFRLIWPAGYRQA